MPITVDNALRRAMREHPGAVGIRIERAPLSEASAVLAQLRRELLSVADDARWGPILEREGIPGIPYVSGVSRGPSAVGLWFDAKDAPEGLLDWVVDELVRHLDEAQIQDALLTSPPPSRLATSDRALLATPNSVSLRLFPDPPVIRNGVPTPIPIEWLRMAFDWLRAELPQLEHLSIIDLLMDEPAQIADAEAFLDRARDRQAMQALVLAGSPDHVVATIGGYFAVSASLSISVAGPALDERALLLRVERLRQFARSRSEEVSLAMLSVDRWLGPALGMLPQTTIWQDGDGAQSGSVYHLCDELLFDAYPYQIIGPGHLRRLGGSPPGSAGLPGGRMEYAAGDLRDWLPSSPRRDAALAAARRALAPCLVTNRVAQDLFLARWGHRKTSDDGGP